MIYINNYSGTITIPKVHSDEYSAKYAISVTSNLGNERMIAREAINISTNPLYYKFTIGDVHLDFGEYTYKLIGYPNEVLETGLLVFGEYKSGVINYNTNKEKIQYNG